MKAFATVVEKPKLFEGKIERFALRGKQRMQQKINRKGRNSFHQHSTLPSRIEPLDKASVFEQECRGRQYPERFIYFLVDG